MSVRSDRGQGAAQRAAAIVETVERAASGIIDEAEEEARRHVESSRLRAEREAAERLRDATDLADGLVERAERLRIELDGLIEALGSTRVRLEETLAEGDEEVPPQVVEMPTPQEPPVSPVDPEPTEAPGPMLTTVPEPDSEAEAEPAGPEPGSDRSGSISTSGARLLATQMAMAGNGRQEVAAHLEKELPQEEVSHILDAVFGPED